MTAVYVTIIDQVSSEGPKRELATRLTDLLSSLDRDHQPGTNALAGDRAGHASEIVAECAPDQRIASLNYAAWHAHVAGSRRWVPVGGRR